MSTTLSIARREFRSYFNSPIAYVVICLGLASLGFVFFFYNGGFWQENRASLNRLFIYGAPGLSFLVVPVLTMRLVAEERASGTLEMLITLPVKDRDVILGKFLGAWGLVMVLILATTIYPLAMFGFWKLGSIDTGPIFASYLGLTLYSAAAVSIGLFISSLAHSQIIAFFITFMTLSALHVVGFALTLPLPVWAEYAVTFINTDARLGDFARGLINTRDVIYFVSITIMCLLGS
ncbi:MAG: ABC transporter permease, partial [Myxococcota bacterium]